MPELEGLQKDGLGPGGRHSGGGLRRWQRAAVATWDSLGGPQDYLAEATPGAGKTTFALHLVSRWGRSTRDPGWTLGVLCPTAHLRRQWQDAAHRHGIELCTDVEHGGIPPRYRGAALTYQQVLANPERCRRALGRGWVILDECHHAGEGRSWADALAHAFGHAQHRLSLSGTAFRSDSARIPFVRYDEEGFSSADYRYGYGEALRDGVVRPVYFVAFGGDAAWHKRGRVRAAGLDQVVSREDSAARLRTVLDPAGGWMAHAVQRAHERLIQVRAAGHATAGALAVCMDQEHARRVARLITSVTGVVPAVALSDDPAASQVIERFSHGREPWIVAVRQVSEGTDIPRLRVGLWATNAGTSLFFRQVVGRLVRTLPGLAEQHAYLYLPSDPMLVRHARSLAEERLHQIDETEPVDEEDQPSPPRTSAGGGSDFQALSSAPGGEEVVFGSRVVGSAELERARMAAEAVGLTTDSAAMFAFALRQTAGAEGTDMSMDARREALRVLLAWRVQTYCAASGISRREAYARLKQRAGRPVSRLAEAWLATHIHSVDAWLRLEKLTKETDA